MCYEICLYISDCFRRNRTSNERYCEFSVMTIILLMLYRLKQSKMRINVVRGWAVAVYKTRCFLQLVVSFPVDCGPCYSLQRLQSPSSPPYLITIPHLGEYASIEICGKGTIRLEPVGKPRIAEERAEEVCGGSEGC